jgi:hypothetical protein
MNTQRESPKNQRDETRVKTSEEVVQSSKHPEDQKREDRKEACIANQSLGMSYQKGPSG